MMIYHEQSGIANHKQGRKTKRKFQKANLEDTLIFNGFVMLFQAIFTAAWLNNKRFREAVLVNCRIRIVYIYKNLRRSVILNSMGSKRDEISYEIEFIELKETLSRMVESPKNILGLMTAGKIKTDGKKNPYYLFFMGFLAVLATEDIDWIIPKIQEFLGILGAKKPEKKLVGKPVFKRQWVMPDTTGMTLPEKLVAQMHNTKPHVSISNARLITEFFKRNEGGELSRSELWARALAYSFENMPIIICDGPIVGSMGEHLIVTAAFPWLFGYSIFPDLVGLNDRVKDPTQITKEQIRDLVEIFAYWGPEMNPYAWAKKNSNGGYKSFRITELLSVYMPSLTQMVSHVIPRYELILKKGLLTMIQENEQRAEVATDPEKAAFFRAEAIVLRGVLELSKRYAQKCRTEAESATPERSKELIAIAKCLDNAPASPAENLHEALIAINILRIAIGQESFPSGLSIGRLDVLLEPYYQKDLAEGILTREKALELIACFLIRLNDVMPLVPDSASDFISSPTNQAVTVGGGEEALETSFLIVEATGIVDMLEPNLAVRINENSRGLLEKSLEVLKKTGASLAFYGDVGTIPVLIEKTELSEEDARDYGVIGCVEPGSNGKGFHDTGSAILNAAMILKLAIFGGWHHSSNSLVGRETKPLAQCKTFEEFYANLAIQIGHTVRNLGVGNLLLWQAHQKLCPTPLLSAFIVGTDESGRDVIDGGAQYNSTGVAVIGVANLVDSVMAIKELVFEKKLISPKELSDALLNDFAGKRGEVIRQTLLNKASKFGKDEAATAMAVKLERLFENAFSNNIGARGEKHLHGYWSMSSHGIGGRFAGATPDGKKASDPLTSGLTPARHGTVDILSTFDAVSRMKPANGLALNIMVGPSELCEKTTADALMVALTKKGLLQVQISAYTKETLLDAIEHPERYPRLKVKVSGFNAHFVNLPPSVQLEIIGRFGG